jgi:hypothetical protein
MQENVSGELFSVCKSLYKYGYNIFLRNDAWRVRYEMAYCMTAHCSYEKAQHIGVMYRPSRTGNDDHQGLQATW